MMCLRKFPAQFQNKYLSITLVYIDRGLIEESKKQKKYRGQCACFRDISHLNFGEKMFSLDFS